MELSQIEPIQNWHEWALHLLKNHSNHSIWNQYTRSFRSTKGMVPFGTVLFGSSVNRQSQMEQGLKRTGTAIFALV